MSPSPKLRAGLVVLALLPALGIGCTNPRLVAAALEKTQGQIASAQDVHARICAPRPFAEASSNLDFARLEFMQGDVRRANEHLDRATAAAQVALEAATPCGTADADMDGVADVVDRCPGEKEDLDDDQDDDGCRDIDPEDDEDKDGIANIDDACIDAAEDFDGDRDDDGCPETSSDSDGDSIIDAVDNCPEEPEDIDGWEDEDGYPDPDNDRDGIPDILDGCDTIREDLDGWNDHDGCPDPDNDADGIPDSTDACPDEAGDRFRSGCPLADADEAGISDANDRCPAKPETANGYLDGDGCPDTPPTKVRVTNQAIELLQPITFVSGQATLSQGTDVLDEIAQVLKDAPDLTIRVGGHTDSDGDSDANQVLSERRARAIRIELIRRGANGDHIEAVGYGDAKPIAPNRTPAGRAQNRRVEIEVTGGFPAGSGGGGGGSNR